MSLEEQATSRFVLQPRQHIDRPEQADHFALSKRNYASLEPVNVEAMIGAAALRDDDQSVMAPIGGYISLGSYAVDFDDSMSFEIDDAVPVRYDLGTMRPGQIPMMIDAQPTEHHDSLSEFDFGREPTIHDLFDSVKGQQKPEEQVLGFPAWPFIREMIANSQEGHIPSEVQSRVYYDLAFMRRGWCETDTRFLQLLPYITFWKIVDGRMYVFVYQRTKKIGEERLGGGCSVGVGGHLNPVDFLTAQVKFHKPDEEVTDNITSMTMEPTGRVFVEGFWQGILNNVVREGSEEVEITQKNDQEPAVVIDLEQYIKWHAAENSVSPEQWLHRRTSFFLDYAANAVEKVHLGMFISIQVPENFEISTREDELIDVGFIDVQALYDQQTQSTAPWDSSATPTPLECWSSSIIASLVETREFVQDNNMPLEARSAFVRNSSIESLHHPVDPEMVAKIPPEDRWKIGTLAANFGEQFRFYALNAFVHI